MIHLKDISTHKLLLELSTRKCVTEILVVEGNQDFKVKIGATQHEFEGPSKLIIINND